MTPLTDDELLALDDVADACDEGDAYFTPSEEPTIRTIEKLSPAGNYWVGLPPDIARRVAVEIRRLREGAAL